MASRPKHVLRKVAVAGKQVGRPKNAEIRTREHLTPAEVETLATAAAKRGRYGQRDALTIRMTARHGFRISELCELRWDQIDLSAGLIHIARKKNGVPSTHPLKGDEIRALRQLRRDWPDGRFVFVTERGTPFTRSGLSKMVEAAGKEAKFDFPVHSICCVMPAAITTRTVVRTRERFSSGLDINRYSTPCGTRS